MKTTMTAGGNWVLPPSVQDGAWLMVLAIVCTLIPFVVSLGTLRYLSAFTTQLAALFLLTLTLAQVRGRLTDEQEAAHLKAMRHLPVSIGAVQTRPPSGR